MIIWPIIGSLIFTILAWKRLDWALLFITATLPSYLLRFDIFSIPTTWLETMILIAFVIFILRALIKNQATINWKSPFTTEAILLAIISLIAVGIAGFGFHSLSIWKAYFIEPILLFLMVVNIFKNKKDLHKILWALTISALIVSIFAVFQKMTGLFIYNHFWEVADNRRAVSFFGYPNAVGLFLGPLTLIFIGWLTSLNWKNLQSSIKLKITIFLTIILSILGIYSARSEGALAAVIISLALIGILAGGKKLLISLGIIIILIGGAFYFSPNHSYLIKKIEFNDLSGQIRLQQWKESWNMLKDGRLVSGAGLDNYQTAVKPFHQAGIFFNYDNLPNFDSRLYGSAALRAKYWQPVEIYLYPHNIFLNFWSELGLAGLLLFIWIIGKFIILAEQSFQYYKKAENPHRYLALGLLGAMTTIVVHGLVDVPYFKNDLSAMFWIFLALLVILLKDSKKK